MTRLLKTDLYKMFKMTSFWVLTLITAVLTFLNVFIVYKAGLGGYTAGSALIGSVQSCKLMLIIFVVIFAVTDFSSGTIKNIASKGFSRISMYLSKFIVSICAFIFFAVINTIITFIVCQVMNDPNVTNFYSMTKIDCQQLLITILSMISYIALTLLIATLIRSTGLALTISLLFAFFEQTLVTVLDLLVQKGLKLNFDIVNYTIYGASAAPDHLLRAAIVLLVYLVVFTAIGIFVFQKRDIN